MRLVVIMVFAVATLPEIARADIRIAIGNDVFSEAIPPMDDSGFTNDIDIQLWRPYRAYLVGGRFTGHAEVGVVVVHFGGRPSLGGAAVRGQVVLGSADAHSERMRLT